MRVFAALLCSVISTLHDDSQRFTIEMHLRKLEVVKSFYEGATLIPAHSLGSHIDIVPTPAWYRNEIYGNMFLLGAERFRQRSYRGDSFVESIFAKLDSLLIHLIDRNEDLFNSFCEAKLQIDFVFLLYLNTSASRIDNENCSVWKADSVAQILQVLFTRSID